MANRQWWYCADCETVGTVNRGIDKVICSGGSGKEKEGKWGLEYRAPHPPRQLKKVSEEFVKWQRKKRGE